MAQAAKKRRGRPMIAPKEGTRVMLGLRVRPDIKKRIDAAATASGRTQAQEAEFLIERGLIADEIAKLSGTDQETIRQRLIKRARGFQIIGHRGWSPERKVRR